MHSNSRLLGIWLDKSTRNPGSSVFLLPAIASAQASVDQPFDHWLKSLPLGVDEERERIHILGRRAKCAFSPQKSPYTEEIQ